MPRERIVPSPEFSIGVDVPRAPPGSHYFPQDVFSRSTPTLLFVFCQPTPQGHKCLFLLKLRLMKYKRLQSFLREGKRFVKIEERKTHHGKWRSFEGVKMAHLENKAERAASCEGLCAE